MTDRFLSATEYIPTRTIIQPGWVSSSLSAFSRWDNLNALRYQVEILHGD